MHKHAWWTSTMPSPSKLQALEQARRQRSFLPEWAYIAAFILLLVAVGVQRWKINTYATELTQVKLDFMQYIEAAKKPTKEARDVQKVLEDMYFRNAQDRTILIEGRKQLCK